MIDLMDSMLEKAKTKLILIYVLFTSLIIYFLLPISISGVYQANILPNIYLPDAGLESHIGVNPRSIIAYVVLIRILFFICNTDILTTISMAIFFSIFSIICSYILISHLIPGEKKVNTMIAIAYPIVIFGLHSSLLNGYVLSFTIPLSITVLFFLLRLGKTYEYTPMFLVALISWVALGFFWHTFHVITYIIILIFMIIFNLTYIAKTGKTAIKWNLLILISVIFISTWIYLRIYMIEHTVESLNININLTSFFGKGSFAGPYSFRSALPIEFIDRIRYIGYFMAYVIMGLIAIKFGVATFRRIESSPIYGLVTIFLISDMIFQPAYLISSGAAGPMILVFFSYPLLLIFLNNRSETKTDFLEKQNIKKILTLLLLIPILITSVSGMYAHYTEDPGKNLEIDMYTDSFYWITDHFQQKRIVSDASTTGHYQLLYAERGIYKFNQMEMKSIDYKLYEDIIMGVYKNRVDSILVLNIKLFDKHLKFGSLEAWNVFEPIPSECLSQNPHLNAIYNDGRVLVAQ